MELIALPVPQPAAQPLSQQVKGRSCDSCAMCCKLGAIKEVNKPDGQWCKHCSTRSKCDIYALRPSVCESYNCYFIYSDLDESWRPSTCHFMVSQMPNNLVYVSVDADFPEAWRQEPYFSHIHGWSANHRVVVLVREHIYAVYPERIDYLGILHDGYALAATPEMQGDTIIQRTVMVNEQRQILPLPAQPNA